MTRIYQQPEQRWFKAVHARWGAGWAQKVSKGYYRWFNGLDITLLLAAAQAAQVLTSERDAQGAVVYAERERAQGLTALESYCHKD